MLEIEKSLWLANFVSVAGVDEVGRGSLAGPVLSAAVIILSEFAENLLGKVNDSKLVSKSKHESLFYEIASLSTIGIGLSSVEEINKYNISNAVFLSMQRAVSGLSYDCLLVDGNRSPRLWERYPILGFSDIEDFRSNIINSENFCGSFVFNANNVRKFKNDLEIKTIIKGDRKSLSIAAASLCAKYLRDKIVAKLDLNNVYGWYKNAGYGTRSHVEAIKRNGLSIYHRTDFCRKIILNG